MLRLACDVTHVATAGLGCDRAPPNCEAARSCLCVLMAASLF